MQVVSSGFARDSLKSTWVELPENAGSERTKSEFLELCIINRAKSAPKNCANAKKSTEKLAPASLKVSAVAPVGGAKIHTHVCFHNEKCFFLFFFRSLSIVHCFRTHACFQNR